MLRFPPPLTAVVLLLALAAPVAAQDGDPQLDPGSPAGTEYQVPVDRAREEAGGGATAADGALFGGGVKPETTTSPGDGSPPASASTTDADSSGAAPRTPADDEPAGTSGEAPAPAAVPSGGTSLVLVGALAAAVLLSGALAGLAWRRKRPRS